MFLFTYGKNNLRAKFKDRSTINAAGDGYIFYPDQISKGYACSTEKYHELIDNFNKALKWGARVLWLSLLVIIPLMIYIEDQSDFEFTRLTAIPFLLMPFPIAFFRVMKSFNTPLYVLRKGSAA